MVHHLQLAGSEVLQIKVLVNKCLCAHACMPTHTHTHEKKGSEEVGLKTSTKKKKMQSVAKYHNPLKKFHPTLLCRAKNQIKDIHMVI